MSISVIEANVKQDLEVFLKLFNRNRKHQVGRERFEWLYLNNPEGEARGWIVRDERNGEAVAFTSVLPRLVRVSGRDVVCWNCCDFSVDKKYRTLGIALKLRKRAKECVDAGEAPALYAHPNGRMQVVHEKVGHVKIGEMIRFVKPLRSESYIKVFIKNKVLFAILTKNLNALLSLKDIFIKIDHHYTLEWLESSAFGEEYDQFFDEVSRYYTIIGDRRASYLNWRYNDNPLYSTQSVAIRAKDKLVGYIVYYVVENNVVIKDIMCLPNKSVLCSLFGQLINAFRNQGIQSISTILMDTNPIILSLAGLGFLKRPQSSSVYAYAQGDDSVLRQWINGNNWYMTVGDRDV